jgi:hypothetical protein
VRDYRLDSFPLYLHSCYYDFDEDGYFSAELCYGQNVLEVGVCCLPGQYDGSPEAMTHHESYGPCKFIVGTDPHDCDDTITGEGPTIPNISGPANGKVGKEYDYVFVSSNPDDGDVYYYIEWGDGETEEWIGPYASGEEVTVGHTWNSKGTFIVKAKAKDVLDTESDWGTLLVTMPKSNVILFPFLHNFLQNHPFIFKLFNYLLS